MDAREKQSLLDEIVAMTAIPQRQEGDFTSMEYAQKAGCSEPTARRRLGIFVKDGTLATAKVMGKNGVLIRVYRKPDTCAEV